MQFETLGISGLFISAFISSTIAPGGSEAVLAYLVGQPDAKVNLLVLIASIGNTLGALTTWGLGIWSSKKYSADAILSKSQQNALPTVRTWGAWALLFSWLPVVGDGLCFAGGWLRLSFYASLLAIFIGKALRYIAVAYIFI
ncbi:DedA family protein [Methylomonas paludis]|uniref:DedA family protein n=1 Tax=Methylomonas paludis TaxID=1173101 RepID=A0A975R9W8_9GAMM|nr:YqaA family protein [Methylomonas paludis]QWF70626.1 DedA family protein [Methylomonas paludis]